MKVKYQVEELIQLLNSNEELKGDEYQKYLKSDGFIHQLSLDGSFFYVFIDLVKMRYQYISPSVETITGYSADTFMKEGVNFIFSVYHPDVILTQKAIHAEVTDYLSKIPVKDRVNFKFSYDLRLKKADGKYIRLLQRNRFVKFDKQGRPLLMFVVCHEITDHLLDSRQLLLITRSKKGKEDVVYRKEFFTEYENGILTKRETQVRKLISDGYSSKGIALKLNISLNTVLTHRKRIYKKLRSLEE
jgi:hypothetical protein